LAYERAQLPRSFAARATPGLQLRRRCLLLLPLLPPVLLAPATNELAIEERATEELAIEEEISKHS
jgi:hypothetical protein